jgi:predicted DNA-binding transcriptional regulator AlpA
MSDEVTALYLGYENRRSAWKLAATDGRFPRPVSIGEGKRRRWIRAELDEYISALPRANEDGGQR